MASVLSESQLIAIFGQAGTSIVRVPMPILGMVSCHKKIEPQLRGALTELLGRGLSHLISLEQWKAGGGCYVYRQMRGSTRLSHHSWGVALDLNHQTFPQKSTKKQDRRLVEIFNKWGFVNGEVFSTPDPMHFEFIKFVKPEGGEDELDEQARADIKQIYKHFDATVDPLVKRATHDLDIVVPRSENILKAIEGLTEAVKVLGTHSSGPNIDTLIEEIRERLKE